MRVLIVDDKAKVRMMLRKMLSGFNIEFEEAVNGLEAVKQYVASPSDIVLMDVRMPILDGISATDRIVRFDSDAHVVIITDYDDTDCRVDAGWAGCRAFFGKGDLMELRQYILRLQASGATGRINSNLN